MSDPLIPENKIPTSEAVQTIVSSIQVTEKDAYQFTPVDTYRDGEKVYVHFPNGHTTTSTRKIADAFLKSLSEAEFGVGVWGGETVLTIPVPTYTQKLNNGLAL